MQRMDPIEFKNYLERRTKEFAVQTFKLLDAMPRRNSTMVIAYQLGKSASSVGANYREANRSESRDDLIHKVSIAVKEASESCYWYEVLVDLYPMHDLIRQLASESAELRNLLQSINQSTRRKRSTPNQTISNFPVNQTISNSPVNQTILNQTIKQ